MADISSANNKPGARVLRWHHQGWTVGLRWEEKKKTARRSSSSARYPGLFSVTLTLGGRQAGNRLTAHGQLESYWRRQKVYSLAALFSQVCTPDGYGVYRIGDEQVFLATVNGLPSLMADVTGDPGHIARALELFLSFNPTPAAGWKIPSSPDAPLSWETLVAQVKPAQLRVAAVSRGRNLLPVYASAGLGAVLLGGILWWLNPSPEPVTEPEDILAQAEAILVSPPPEPVYLPHPWADMPEATTFLDRCRRWRAAVPVSLDLWRLDRGHCSAEGLQVVYIRLPGGSAARFAERARQVFHRTPVFNLTAGGNEGVVFIEWGGFALRDEPVPEAAEQLMQAVSWFQSRHVAFSLTEVKEEPAMPGEGDDTPQPVQDWREYTFSITEKRMPAWVLQGLDTRGLRVESVAYTLSPQGQFTYQIEGHLYARK